MSINAAMFLLTISVAALFAALTAACAIVLAVLAPTHPAAAALARGGVAFAATLTLAIAVIGLSYTVLR